MQKQILWVGNIYIVPWMDLLTSHKAKIESSPLPVTPTNEGYTWVTQIVTKIAETSTSRASSILSQSYPEYLGISCFSPLAVQPGSQECRHLKLVEVANIRLLT